MKFVLLLLHIYLCQTLLSQEAVDVIVMQLESLAGNRPAEMIYLQTSKGIYETGEDMWFKAYLLDAQTLDLSSRSQTLYLQMVSENGGEIVWQEKYPVENGLADGHVYVRDSLLSGNYSLEAYTHHSFFEDSTEMSAVRKVKIQKSMSKKEKTEPLTGGGFRFEVFPEGGNLVAGLPSVLAFKATDGHGYPVEMNGVLYQDDTPLLEFESVHAGMGCMEFTPLPDKTYQIRLPDGETFPLPEVLPRGITLQLSGRDAEFLEFTLSQSQNGGASRQAFYLTGQLRGMVCCTAKGTLSGKLKVKIPLNEFPGQGIAVFTLFNENRLPVAERLVYIHPEKKLYITATPDKKNYATREKATVTIKVTDEQGQPVTAHLGVSVFDPLYNNPDAPANILTHVYLSSQIKGKIYDPVYYFNDDNPDRKTAMDLLLLTQGWRRYVWLADHLKPKGQTVVTDEITGRQTVKSKKVKSLEQFIQVSDADKNVQLVTTGPTGYFAIDASVLSAFQGGYLYLKPMLSAEVKPGLVIDDPFPVINKARQMKEIHYPLASRNDTVNELKKRPFVVGRDVISLDEVTVTKKVRRPVRDKYMGHLDSLARMSLNAWVCEHGFLNDYKEGYNCYCNNSCHSDTLRRSPVEGERYPLCRIDSIASDGNSWFTPVPVIYHGAIYSDEELLRMNNMWRVKGYYGVREFYQPDEVDILSPFPDFRNTLLWAPSVITDDKGEATVSFYCSDINTGFTGRIEGTDGAGLLGMSAFDFRIIKVQTAGEDDQ
jgi:hypothetical protein